MLANGTQPKQDHDVSAGHDICHSFIAQGGLVGLHGLSEKIQMHQP